MKGTIKNYNEKGFGFIAVENQREDIFFHKSSITDKSVRCMAGEQVEFEAAESKNKPGTLVASNVRHPAGYVPSTLKLRGHPSSFLYQWGYIQLDDVVDDNGNKRLGALHDLEKIALKEDWAYGAAENGKTRFPILKNYLINTFYKLYKDGLVKEANYAGENWASFNTGLVDDRYEPIYCLFKQNDRPPRPWKFFSFCRANIGREGQALVRNFNPLPPAAKYFDNSRDVVFDPDVDVQPRYDHIVYDSIERDRYPSEFLKQHVPSGVSWVDPETLDAEKRAEYLKAFREGIESDARADRSIRNRIDDAIALAVKRARWNFKTAIPLYYPRANSISLLLPVALVSDDHVDLALVVTRTPAGGYSGETVYKLKWAYEHARLVCRPLSDWLTPEAVHDARSEEPGEEEASELSEPTDDAQLFEGFGAEELVAEAVERQANVPQPQLADVPQIQRIGTSDHSPPQADVHEEPEEKKRRKLFGLF